MPRIPTTSDINVYDSLDEQSAVKRFYGRSLEEAEQLFCDNFLSCQEDLFAMGPRAFNFYVLAAVRYLLSPDSNGDSDAISSFCSGLHLRAENVACPLEVDVHTGRDTPAEVRSAIAAILGDFERFDVDESIYGDVRSRYKTLLKRLAD